MRCARRSNPPAVLVGSIVRIARPGRGLFGLSLRRDVSRSEIGPVVALGYCSRVPVRGELVALQGKVFKIETARIYDPPQGTIVADLAAVQVKADPASRPAEVHP